VSDIDTVLVDSLKALDPKRPIREEDMRRQLRHIRIVPEATFLRHRRDTEVT